MTSKQAQFQSLSPRKRRPDAVKEESSSAKNHLWELFKQLFPPFLLTFLSFLFRVLSRVLMFFVNLAFKREEAGESSRQFHRRRYEQSIESIKLKQEQLGFTNQVLVQQGKKAISLYLPVYVTCKIKSIQDVSVQLLTGNISCALIINILYGDIPEEIITKLESSIIVQLNRGEVMLLADDGLTITCKRNKKAKLLIFTIRKVFLAFMMEDTLWSPFELFDLVVSLTLNTVNIAANSISPLEPATGYDPKKQYKISFNCMRNSDSIPISYALDCVFGVYDLAQRKLESYHSKFGTYKQIQKNYQQSQKSEREKKSKEKEKQKEKEKEKNIEKRIKQKNSEKEMQSQSVSITVIPPPKEKEEGMSLIKQVARSTMRRLSMRMHPQNLKKPPKKVKYFQYTHLIIPLYKYPGNSLITIFLPTLLLALLSLAIFFQEPELSGRIGAIATMILGYIALIPSIKEQLPPSSKLTIIQSLVYIETVCCMFILYESFVIRDQKDYQFVWDSNINFLLCLGIHSGTFLFVLGLYLIHKFKWEPSYNLDEKIPEVKPADNMTSWDNPFCDEVFIKYNEEVRKNQFGPEREEQLIVPFKSSAGIKVDTFSEKQGRPPKPSPPSFDLFGAIGLEEEAQKKEEQKNLLNLEPVSLDSASQFVPPDEDSYYGKKA